MKKLFCILLAVVMVLAAMPGAFADGTEPIPFTKVYEPNTSWSLAATIAWEADGSAEEVAAAAVRPATAFVKLDAGLKVYDRDGGVLAENLDDYVKATAAGMIPAFYIEDAETAAALKAYLEGSGLQDCFVVSTPENQALVQDVADLLYVRGMLDYTALKEIDRDTILDMVASVNGAHGKIVILSSEAATRENIKLLQSLCAGVWVQSEADTKSLATHYTNGVNGVLVTDFAEAIRVEELFNDAAPSLLRVPMIIGHRGMPSVYVENTLMSALGAYAAGAESVENDIQLSADGEIFILHDDSPARLLGITDVEMAESLTIDELKAVSFIWDDPDVGVLQKNNQPAASTRYGKIYGTPAMNVIPTLREFIETFKGTGLIHDTEIKSYNPEIIKVYKDLVSSYDAWDQFFTITFNTVILDAAYKDFPELSVGALCAEGYENVAGMPSIPRLAPIVASEGLEAALAKLYGELDKWNATYNPYLTFTYDVVDIGRHRGLTVWPWTYNDPESFAKAYLGGIYGITTNWAWWATDYVVDIASADVTVGSAAEIAKPQATTRAGTVKTLADAQLVCLEGKLEEGSALYIWRYKADMNVGGENWGFYYLYSNPFTVTLAS